jgi:hypothetical protein
VRAESKHGMRLNPRKTDLHRWRETFAEKLRERGIDAEATRQATRGATRIHPELWRLKASEEGRLVQLRVPHRSGPAVEGTREVARQAWKHIAAALGASGHLSDRALATSIERFALGAARDREQTTLARTQARSPGPEGPVR